MGCYYTLYLITYGYYLLFYKVYHEEGDAGSWNYGLEKEQILETYSAHLQKSWNSTEDVFQIYKKILRARTSPGGPYPAHEGGGRALPPRRAPCFVGHWQAPDAHILV